MGLLGICRFVSASCRWSSWGSIMGVGRDAGRMCICRWQMIICRWQMIICRLI